LRVIFSKITRAGFMLKIAPKIFTFSLLVLSAIANTSHADDETSERARARRELDPYFRKQIAIQAALARSSGPEWTEDLFNKKLFGCPGEPNTPTESSKNLFFATGAAGAWAGAVDGINTSITSSDGIKGGGFAVPTNSTARLPEDSRGTELQFFFDGTMDVRRALVDAAAAEFDRCFSRLPPGRYSSEELQRLCPYRPVSRAEQKQTCVTSIYGSIQDPLPDGSGFDVRLIESTVCDFVGYGRSGDTNTGFISCYLNEYRGVATFTADIPPLSAAQKKLRSAKRRMARVCGRTSSGKRMRPGQVKSCVMREMARTMAS